MKTSEFSVEDSISIRKVDFLANIALTKEFTMPGVKIKQWDSEDSTDRSKQYIVEIDRNSINFIGIVDRKLEREGIGLYTYPSGGQFFGMYQKNKRNRQGFYIYPTVEEADSIHYDFYFGTWKNDLRDGNGTYLKITEKKGNTVFGNFDNSNFEAYTGLFQDDVLVRGALLKKDGENYYLYYGNFNKDQQKFGNHVFYYNSTPDELMYGKMNNDKFENAFLGRFDSEGHLNKLIYSEYDEDSNITNYKQGEEYEEEERNKVTSQMSTFRNIILSEDFFGDLFNAFQEIYAYLHNTFSAKIFESSDEFPKMIDATFGFNGIKIFQKLDKGGFPRD